MCGSPVCESHPLGHMVRHEAIGESRIPGTMVSQTWQDEAMCELGVVF